MTGLPAGIKFEYEQVVNSGSWTDITSYVHAGQGFSIKTGRASQFTVPSASTLSLTLFNDLGTWTPNRQVLTDGVTVNTFYPNVVPGRRIRMSYTISGTTYYRFVGKVQGFYPTVDGDGANPLVLVTALDQLQHLSRVKLASPLLQAARQDGAMSLYPLTEPAGATSAVDAFAASQPLAVTQVGAGGTLVFGDTGPGFGDGTGVKMTPSTTSNGLYLLGRTPISGLLSTYTVEAWVNMAAVPASPGGVAASLDFGATQAFTVQVTTSGFAQVVDAVTSTTLTGAANLADGGWHHIVGTRQFTLPTTNLISLYVDGSLITSATPTHGVAALFPGILRVGQAASTASSALFKGNIGYVGLYSSALSSTVVAQHFQAGRGFVGDTTGARIQRWLGAAGLTSANWTLDTGSAVIGTYPQSGRYVFDACQDMVTSEGGGAAFYQLPDGHVRFADRNYRKPAAPVLTVDGAADLDVGTLSPALDLATLANSSTVQRATESGTQTTQVFTNAASIAAYDESDDDITVYNTTDADSLDVAQYRITTQSTPGYRLPQVAVDLLTATSSGLYPAVATMQIGDRVRVTNLEASVAPGTQLDVIAEGWTETGAIDQYKIVIDGSPADNPAFGIWGGTSDYSRWQASGMTLNTTVTASGTTVIITTGAGLPTLTTVGARYPMNVQIDEEVMTFNSAPGGSTSPQTFTGVTRGVAGTPKAAHSAGAVFNLYPAVCWAL